MLPNRGQQAATKVMERIRARVPFPLLGVDSDNDPAFIRAHLFRYCEEKKLEFSRCWPYHKNDQAHVGEMLDSGTEAHRLRSLRIQRGPGSSGHLRELAAIFELLSAPIRKLVEKKRVGGKVRKKYDQAKTQYVRVLAFPDLEEKEKERLRKVYQTLTPVELRRRVEKNLTKLRRLHG